MYHGMVGSLLYLTASRPDIMFSVCKCARFQATPKESYLTAVKRIICYLIGTTELGLWYPYSSHFNLIGYSNADFTGDKNDRKNTSGTCQIMGQSLISWHSKKQTFVAYPPRNQNILRWEVVGSPDVLSLSSDSFYESLASLPMSSKRKLSAAKTKDVKKAKPSSSGSLSPKDMHRFWGMEQKNRYERFKSRPIVPGRVVNLSQLQTQNVW
ncbi:uncharacterized protein LOC125861336 [Solanum stenotomum]|uniref:uncharacterized protein LOC125861336 n=1 Tax=Solanum stenotomum TaxID=172797 RepID=UPI0020D1B37B|nr:uncharacterized protein LOC125861336 [Solanum stenotomum]